MFAADYPKSMIQAKRIVYIDESGFDSVQIPCMDALRSPIGASI